MLWVQSNLLQKGNTNTSEIPAIRVGNSNRMDARYKINIFKQILIKKGKNKKGDFPPFVSGGFDRTDARYKKTFSKNKNQQKCGRFPAIRAGKLRPGMHKHRVLTARHSTPHARMVACTAATLSANALILFCKQKRVRDAGASVLFVCLSIYMPI